MDNSSRYKFRTWDRVYKDGMKRVNTLNFGTKGWTKVNNSNYSQNRILMQFTGIKDRQGKEIYEGDIVFLPAVDDSQPDARKVGIVRYYSKKTPMFGIERNGWLEKYWKELKVVGNIFENPEFMTDANKEEG